VLLVFALLVFLARAFVYVRGMYTAKRGHTGQDSQNGTAKQQERLNRTTTTGNWHNRTAGLNGILGRKGGAVGRNGTDRTG
jgi:hypothetical protein